MLLPDTIHVWVYVLTVWVRRSLHQFSPGFAKVSTAKNKEEARSYMTAPHIYLSHRHLEERVMFVEVGKKDYYKKASNWDVIKWMVQFNGIWHDHTGGITTTKTSCSCNQSQRPKQGNTAFRSASCTTASRLFSCCKRQLILYLDRQENKYELMRYQSTAGSCSSLLPVSNS